MRIKRVELKNFRGFEELTINFPEAPNNVAVFVGVNGAGKTSVLDGIVNVLQGFFDDMFDIKYSHEVTQFIEHRNISNIRKNEEKATIVAEIFHDTFGSYNTEIDILKTGRTEFNITGEGNASNARWKEHGGARENFRKNPSFFTSYPTDRFVKNNPDLNPINLGELSPIDVFKQSLSKEIDFDDFFKWFRSYDVENEQIRVTDNFRYRSKELDAVRKAISIFLPNFKNPRVQRQPQEELIVEKNGEKLSISNLSHGERLMFAMVGDIARRLSIANPSLEDPLQGEGVVLIDEIELHLHPGWQRKIVPLLTQTFPNIQFILTTHSPQVISSVERESVFILKNFKLIESPFTLGRDTNSLLHDVFQEEERPAWSKEKLVEFYDLLEKEDVENAEKVLDELREAFGNGDSEIQRAEVHLSLIAD